MRGRWTGLAGIGAAVALVAAGCGGSTNTSGSGGAGASVVPASVSVYVAADGNLSSDQWQAADALLKKFPGRAALLTQLRTSFEKSAKLKWETDVKPALGDELDVAVLDFAHGGTVVGLTQPKDAAKFDALVKKANASDPTSHLVAGDYKGWKILSDSQAKLDAFTKAADAGPALADDSTFKDAMGKLKDSALVKVYANGEKLTAQAKQTFAQLASPVGGAKTQGKLVSAAAELVAETDGLRLDGTAITSGVTAAQPKPYKAALLDQVPAGALLYASFSGEGLGNQANFRKQFEQGFLGTPAGSVPGLKSLLPLFEQLGGVFAHENAFYVRPGAPIPEVTLVTQPDSPEQATAALDKLVAKLSAMAGTKITPKPVTIGTVKASELNLGQISIYYGTEAGKLIVTTQQQAFQDLKAGGPNLAGDATFKEAVAAAAMPEATNGFLYVDVKDTIPLVQGLAQLSGANLPAQVMDNVRPLRTVLAWATLGESESTAALFVEIK
jgi:hypothetical protein